MNAALADLAGVNYCWNTMEGPACFNAASCNMSGLPVTEYDHGQGRCSVTGGYVYRGSLLPEIVGHYFFLYRFLAELSAGGRRVHRKAHLEHQQYRERVFVRCRRQWRALRCGLQRLDCSTRAFQLIPLYNPITTPTPIRKKSASDTSGRIVVFPFSSSTILPSIRYSVCPCVRY